MTTKEIRSLIEWARDNGVLEIKVGDVEVKFAQSTKVIDSTEDVEAVNAQMENFSSDELLYYASS